MHMGFLIQDAPFLQKLLVGILLHSVDSHISHLSPFTMSAPFQSPTLMPPYFSGGSLRGFHSSRLSDHIIYTILWLWLLCKYYCCNLRCTIYLPGFFHLQKLCAPYKPISPVVMHLFCSWRGKQQSFDGIPSKLSFLSFSFLFFPLFNIKCTGCLRTNTIQW